MSKLFVSDLDGTLLNAKHSLAQETIDAIHTIYDHGDTFAIATGRHHEDVVNVAAVINRPVEMISSNGAVVAFSDGVSIVANTISPKITQKIVNYGYDGEVFLNIYTESHWYTLRHNEKLAAYSVQGGFTPEVVTREFLAEQQVIKVFLWGEDSDTLFASLSKIQTFFNSESEGELDCFFSHPSCLEVMPAGISKGVALKKLGDALGYSSNEIIAFGDGENDIDMLQYAGTSLIMENGADRVKEVVEGAEIIGHAHENGVAQYINSYYRGN